MIEALRAVVQQVVDALLDCVQPHYGMDFVADFAQPLPAIVIAEMFGILPEDGANSKRWSDDVIRVLGSTFGSIEEDVRRVNEGPVNKACGMSRTSAPGV